MNSESSTPLAGKKMSQSLRERLRKSGRSYKSPMMKKGPSVLDTDNHIVSLGTNKASPSCSIHNKNGSTNCKDLNCDKDKYQKENGEISIIYDESKSVTAKMNTHHSPLKNSPGPSKTRTYPPLHSSVRPNFNTDLVEELGNFHQNSKQERKDLLQRISNKEERLRKLRMVKMYRTKNNLEEVGNLISKWRTISQEALMELLNEGDPKPTLKKLLEHLQINHDLMHFNEEEDSFE